MLFRKKTNLKCYSNKDKIISEILGKNNLFLLLKADLVAKTINIKRSATSFQTTTGLYMFLTKQTYLANLKGNHCMNARIGTGRRFFRYL